MAISEDDSTNYGLVITVESKRSLSVLEVSKGMLAIPNGPLVEADEDVDICSYRYFGERAYVANISALPTKSLAA